MTASALTVKRNLRFVGYLKVSSVASSKNLRKLKWYSGFRRTAKHGASL